MKETDIEIHRIYDPEGEDLKTLLEDAFRLFLSHPPADDEKTDSQETP